MGYYAVRQGDCLSSIAETFGFGDFETIYQHPENAGFRKKRPNPNIICPGDVLFIPDLETKQHVVATDQKHSFVLKRAQVRLRLRLEDDLHRPYKETKYQLRIGQKYWRGSTNGSGMVNHEIPADAVDGEITIFPSGLPEDSGYTFLLHLGHLDPVEEDAGVDARLLNLGYGPVETEGSLSDAERADALKQFQADHGLQASGELTDETRSKLRERHDGE
jgi:N-acetylmuramoyl-L-alanine amidase